MLVQVAEAGPLPSAERVVGQRHWDREIDANHADLHAAHEIAGGVAVAGEDGDAVAIFVLGRQPNRFLVVVRAHHGENRAENLFLVDLHVRLDRKSTRLNSSHMSNSYAV